MSKESIEFTIIKSEQSPLLGAEVGVRVKDLKTGLIAESTSFSTQHKNKLAALEQLKEAIVKERFSNIDEDELIDGNDFLDRLDSEKPY